MATFLTRTTGNPTLGTKCTVSAWVKINEVPGGSGTDRWLFGEYGNSSNHSYLYLRNSSEIGWYEADGSGTVASIITTRYCRDLNGWYHFMIVYDTTDSTQADRFKMYINGERQSSFSTNTNSIAQNYLPRINRTGRAYRIGGVSGYQTMFTGSMSHYHHCDGSALAPTVFGSTDSTTGEWKINSGPSFTLGNNGFSILKDGNTITDQSTNSNDFALGGGTLTKTEDCPSNVFATMNPLDNQVQGSTFYYGNNEIEWNTNNRQNHSTLAMNAGKFYWEVKYTNDSGGANGMLGISLLDSRQGDAYVGHDSNSWAYYFSNGNNYHNGSTASYGASVAAGDIVGVAFDADSRTIWFSKNGVWQGSATIAEIAAGTTTNSMFTGIGTAGQFFIPAMSGYDGNKAEFNFGNGYFKTTAVSSAGTNASGIGIFEYDVPTGFTALCTKGLNE